MADGILFLPVESTLTDRVTNMLKVVISQWRSDEVEISLIYLPIHNLFYISGFQFWLHIGITWGAFQNYQCLGHIPEQLNQLSQHLRGGPRHWCVQSALHKILMFSQN